MALSMTGLILAGGQSSRMRDAALMDADKGLLDFCGGPLVAHAREFLAPWVCALLISANRHEWRYAEYGQVIGDDPTLGNSLGPLAGIERALAAARTPWLLVLPVDVVGLPDDLVRRLAAAVDDGGPLMAYAATPESAHPLCAIMHASLQTDLRDYLQAGGRKVRSWLAQRDAVPVLFQGSDLFLNINTPEDLRYASQCLKS